MNQSTFEFREAGAHVHPDFFPTPGKLARRMVELMPAGCRNILEPSAGKGDLAQTIADRQAGGFNSRIGNVDVIEIIPELQAVLRDKHFSVAGADFLQFQGHKSYDVIIMNPPFSEGAKHVLHAWELIYSGVVIALLNAETVRNPHTKERQLLARVIEDNGEIVETIEGGFFDAERKTDVDVVIIRLTRERTVEHDYFEGMEEGGPATASEEEAPEFKELALAGSQIGNKVKAFNLAVDATRLGFIRQAEAKHFRRMLLEGEDRYNDQEDLTAWVKRESNEALAELQRDAWQHIVHLSEFRSIMSANTLRDFEHSLTEVEVLEFTETNIRQFLLNLLADRERIFNDSLLEVFDELTRYYPENRVHIEGWKSDNYFFVNKRVVLPYIVNFDYGLFSWGYGAHSSVLHDLDRVMAYMHGRRDTVRTVYRAVDKYRNGGGSPLGVKIESEHFYIRVFKKGTIHLYFRDMDALARFNLAAGRLRGWLPKADELVPKEFWLMNK